MGLTCWHCGTELPDHAKYCLECGRPVTRRGPARVFAIANQMGRVGKTTTAVNLGAYLAESGHETLVVDVCPSSSATSSVGIAPYTVETSIYEVMVTGTASAAASIIADVSPGLSVLPSSANMYASDIELPFLEEREYRLMKALQPIKDRYEYILIDCPSWLGLLTINALAAADGVILPLQCEYFALEGFQQLLKTIKLVRDRLNPNVQLFGVVLTMYDPRTKLDNEIVKEIQDHFPREKFNTIIPRNVRLKEAPTFGLTILQHDPRSPGALAYKDLADEVTAHAEAEVPKHA